MKTAAVVLALAGVAALLAAPASVRAEGRTVAGRIERIDPDAGTITVVDALGTGWNFKVSADAGIDLRGFKAGERVSVTIRRATPLNMMSAADLVRKGDRIEPSPGY